MDSASTKKIKDELVSFLKENMDTFAWAAEDMLGIDIGVTSHELNIDPFGGMFPTAHRGIEVNPKQIDALIQMTSPKSKREVQRRTGRVAALNRFISRSTDKCLPFYDTLRGNKKFEWTEKCEEAFQQLKKYLASPSVLAKPVEGEPLFLYTVISTTAVSGVLICDERGEHKPIFYVSKTITDAETRYPHMEK